jgi:DNA-binding NarL/FixJ family response regulator
MLRSEYEVVGAVADGQSLIDVESKTMPDVCVIDISMPVLDGLGAATELDVRRSKAKIVFLTVNEDPDFLRAALKMGALGYVLKSRMASDLCPAIKEALAGRPFISPSIKLRS